MTLNVEHLTMRFGGLTAISDLSFSAHPNTITALIGPNGAGKTTVFNCLSGFYRPSQGSIGFSRPDGKNFRLERMAAYRIAREAGVVRTFQNVRLFANMSVLENLVIAQLARGTRRAVERARRWLDKVGLLGVADEAAGSLPYGSQRRLEIARAMCAGPSLLCLDEPAAGLNPHESHELTQLLLGIREEHGVAILLIEHDMNLVMRISDHIVVLDHGVRIAEGAPAAVRANPQVISAYLGESDGA